MGRRSLKTKTHNDFSISSLNFNINETASPHKYAYTHVDIKRMTIIGH